MQPMATAPRDRTIDVYVRDEWWPVYFVDCRWLREGPDAVPGVTDCWRVADLAEEIDLVCLDFQLNEPEGWRETEDWQETESEKEPPP